MMNIIMLDAVEWKPQWNHIIKFSLLEPVKLHVSSEAPRMRTIS
jgi:hypothetical protein